MELCDIKIYNYHNEEFMERSGKHMIRKYLRYMIYFVIYIGVLILITWLIHRTENVAYFVTGEYPVLGEYYISFSKEDDITVGSVYYRQFIYNEEIDLTNLILHLKEDEEYIIDDKKNIYNDKEIRINLLKSGWAELEDVESAPILEQAAQEEAIEKKQGVWNTETKHGKIKLHSILNGVILSLDSDIGKILIAVGKMIGFVTIIWAIVCLVMRHRNIDVILMGGTSSGKSTTISRLRHPYITENELLTSVPTKVKEVTREKFPYGKMIIRTSLYDFPGNQLGKMVGELKRNIFLKGEKQVVIYVVSFTAYSDEEKDTKYMYEEITKAAAVIQILNNKRLIKGKLKIIVFFNKCDLLYDSEQLLLKDEEHQNVKNKYDGAESYETVCRLADYVIYGSAIKGWKTNELVKQMIDMY